jgi:hypothetical protein
VISQLASPSVCVIDNEEDDYRPILAALNDLYVGCVHILGDDVSKLPLSVFSGLRLVFVDLHLSGTVGKDAASHTANVFLHVVSPDAAPVVVVIWSKYASDLVAQDGVPPEDQETEAALFKRTLLGAEPKYKGRLIFLEMAKPKPSDQPGDWVAVLKQNIGDTLNDQSATDVFWKWDSIVRDACIGVSSILTSLAAQSGDNLAESLKDVMRRLAHAQGEGNFSPETAPRHLTAALGELLTDHLEHSDKLANLADHGQWLGAALAGAGPDGFSARMNGLLLSANLSPNPGTFTPGTVYRSTDNDRFSELFGKDFTSLVLLCGPKATSQKHQEWLAHAKLIAIEISPECDVAQGYRSCATLLAGLIVPTSVEPKIKTAESRSVLPTFYLRIPSPEFAAQDATIVFSHRHKATLPLNTAALWLHPWFRLRELPTAAVRNQQAGQASRVGYVSLST